jgi:hypothetical protein
VKVETVVVTGASAGLGRAIAVELGPIDIWVNHAMASVVLPVKEMIRRGENLRDQGPPGAQRRLGSASPCGPAPRLAKLARKR